MSCSRTQRSDVGEPRTSIPLSRIKHSSYHYATALPINMNNRTQINKYFTHISKKQFKYRNQFLFLSTMIALLEMTQRAMSPKIKTGSNTKQGQGEFSLYCINIKRKQLRVLVTFQSEKNNNKIYIGDSKILEPNFAKLLCCETSTPKTPAQTPPAAAVLYNYVHSLLINLSLSMCRVRIPNSNFLTQ